MGWGQVHVLCGGPPTVDNKYSSALQKYSSAFEKYNLVHCRNTASCALQKCNLVLCRNIISCIAEIQFSALCKYKSVDCGNTAVQNQSECSWCSCCEANMPRRVIEYSCHLPCICIVLYVLYCCH